MRISAGEDTGGVVVGWLVKLVALFAVLGVLAFDGISVAVAGLAVTDTAAAASRAASEQLDVSGNPQLAYGAAVETALADSVDNEVPTDGFSVAADGTVTVTVLRQPPTLLLHHVPRSERWLVTTASASHSEA